MKQPPATNKEINELIASLTKDPDASNDIALGTDIIEMERAKNGGYPRNMYHQSLQPVIVTNRSQESAVSARGYVRNYIHQEFPRMLHRRNPDVKFKASDYVESRTVIDDNAMAALMKSRTPEGCSEWGWTAADLPEIVVDSKEAQSLMIAKLQGQLEELRKNQEAQNEAPKRGPGRPPKQTEEES